MIGRDVTEVAIGTSDVQVPFSLKRMMVRPILMGLRNSILRRGDISILGFGRFYVVRKKVSMGIGSKEKKLILTVAFRPARAFRKLAQDAFMQKTEVEIT